MIPIELVEAREQRDAAWSLYGRSIDDEGYTKEMRDTAGQVAEAWDDTCQDWYNRWQKLGGTSDIRSIVEAETDPRIARQNDIMATFENEPVGKENADAMIDELAEIEASLQANPAEIVDGVSSPEWYAQQDELEF